MNNFSRFNKYMLVISLLSWILVTLMPVINANNGIGVWATLCTVNGLELVQIEEGKAETHEGNPCPFSHFSSFHHSDILTDPVVRRVHTAAKERYVFWPHNVRYQWQVPRAPPLFPS